MGFTMTSTDAITDTGTGQVEPDRVRQYGDVFSEFASTQDPEGPDRTGGDVPGTGVESPGPGVESEPGGMPAEEGGDEGGMEEGGGDDEEGGGEGEQPAVPENPPEPASVETRSISYGEDK